MPGYRGRLLNPFVARIAQLDISGTAADPDGAGTQTSGYDSYFREPINLPSDDVQQGVSARKELPVVELPCQVEDEAWQALEMMRTGNSPRTQVSLVFHFRDLERLHLVDARGDVAVPRIGDRLVSIHRKRDMVTVVTVDNPPGLFCVQSRPASFGLSGADRNLLLVVFEDRATSQRAGGG